MADDSKLDFYNKMHYFFKINITNFNYFLHSLKNIGIGLAPMVRVGTLAFRLECLKYGADFVWTEELIDVKLSTCQRIENHRLNTVDFLLEKDTTVRPVFQTCEAEKPFVILQLGTSNPEEALKAAKLVEKDVAAIEVNMGCPKEYSTKAGMGAALLSTPDLAASILDKLVKNLSIPVTAKIRCLSSISETVNFCDKLAKTGISLLSIHGRQRPERPRHPVRLEWITEVRKEMKKLHPNLPIWVNGVSFTPLDSRKSVDNILSETNCDGIMIARAAFRNPSIFAEKMLSSTEVTRSYIETALKYRIAHFKINVHNFCYAQFRQILFNLIMFISFTLEMSCLL